MEIENLPHAIRHIVYGMFIFCGLVELLYLIIDFCVVTEVKGFGEYLTDTISLATVCLNVVGCGIQIRKAAVNLIDGEPDYMNYVSEQPMNYKDIQLCFKCSIVTILSGVFHLIYQVQRFELIGLVEIMWGMAAYIFTQYQEKLYQQVVQDVAAVTTLMQPSKV